jgi:hypothetical protein
MADVAITKSKSITIRGGQIPSNPVIPETPEDPVTLPSTPPHNNLSGLQGGNSTERYHIDKDQWDAVDGSNAPDAGNPFATMADVGGGGMPPIDGSYASEAAMIADQASQTAQYIYFDGTAYWEYLGTTTPSIADYRQISGGGSDPNKVSYNVADGKTASEQLQARNNIGSTSSNYQIVTDDVANIVPILGTSNNLIFTGLTANRNLAGIQGATDGLEVTIYNDSTFNLTIQENSAATSTTNRFDTGSTVTIPPRQYVRVKYNARTGFLGRWVLEALSIAQALYLRKDIADTKTGILTIAAAGGTDAVAVFTNSGGRNHFTMRRSAAGTTFFIAADTSRFSLGINPSSTNIQGLHFGTDGSVHIAYLAGATVAAVPAGYGAMSHGGHYFVNKISVLGVTQRAVTVATAGTINNYALNLDSHLILTAATDLTGAVGEQGRNLLIEARGVNVIIRHESASSTAANRFFLPGAVDLTINSTEIYNFIYTNGRWRKIL